MLTEPLSSSTLKKNNKISVYIFVLSLLFLGEVWWYLGLPLLKDPEVCSSNLSFGTFSINYLTIEEFSLEGGIVLVKKGHISSGNL